MENFFTHISFENAHLWAAKAFCSNPQSHECASTCTSLSQTSRISYPFFNIEREEDEQSQFSHYHPNSPANSEDLEESLPDGSVYANDGSFDERFQDNFTDLLQNYDDNGLHYEEEVQEEGQVEEGEQVGCNVEALMGERKPVSAAKHGKMLFEAWKTIRKLFLKYLGTPDAVRIIKEEMEQERALWESGMKSIYKMLGRQAKKISRGDIMNFAYNNSNSDDYMMMINRLFQRLFVDFMREKAVYAVTGLINVSGNLRRMMLDILATTSRSIKASRG